MLKWLDRCMEGAADRTLQWTSEASGLLYTAHSRARAPVTWASATASI